MDQIERIARAMAKSVGWEAWDTAKDCRHTPDGSDPEYERNYWRGLAKAALAASAPAGAMKLASVDTPELRHHMELLARAGYPYRHPYEDRLIAHVARVVAAAQYATCEHYIAERDTYRRERDDQTVRAEKAELTAKARLLELESLREECRRHALNVKASAPQQHAQALYADKGQQHEEPTGPNHPGHHDGHTCAAMGQMLADFGSQHTTPEAVVADLHAQAALSDDQIIAIKVKVGDGYNSAWHLSDSAACEFARAILAISHQPAAAPEDATDEMAMAVRHYDIFDVLPDTALRAVAKSIYRDMLAAAPAQPEVKP